MSTKPPMATRGEAARAVGILGLFAFPSRCVAIRCIPPRSIIRDAESRCSVQASVHCGASRYVARVMVEANALSTNLCTTFHIVYRIASCLRGCVSSEKLRYKASEVL